MVCLVVELDCTIDAAEYTSVVLHLRRVAIASFVANRCYMEDTSDLCSS